MARAESRAKANAKRIGKQKQSSGPGRSGMSSFWSQRIGKYKHRANAKAKAKAMYKTKAKAKAKAKAMYETKTKATAKTTEMYKTKAKANTNV